MAFMKFYVGNEANASSHRDGIYIAIDTKKIFYNGDAYGGSEVDLSRYIYNSYNPINGEGYEIDCRACEDEGTHDSFRISCKARQSTPVINFSTFPSYNDSTFRDNTGIAIYPRGIFFGCYSGTGVHPVITDIHGNYKEPDEYLYSRCFIENDTNDLAFGTKKTSDGSHGNFIFYYGNIKLMSSSQGVIIPDKTTSDLLHAAGGTTTLKTINGESLLGSGDITTPAPTVNAASGTKIIWTGTQSEYDGVTSKDTNTLYFITEE